VQLQAVSGCYLVDRGLSFIFLRSLNKLVVNFFKECRHIKKRARNEPYVEKVVGFMSFVPERIDWIGNGGSYHLIEDCSQGNEDYHGNGQAGKPPTDSRSECIIG